MAQPQSLEDIIAADVANLPKEEQPTEYPQPVTAYPEPAPGAGTLKSPGPALLNTAKAIIAPQNVDYSYGMSGPELGLAGAGGWLSDLGNTIAERGRMAFRPDGPEGQAIMDEINRDRLSRHRINQELYQNPEANFGKFGAQALVSAAAPSRVGAQMATFGTLGANESAPGQVKGLPGELMSAGIKGATDAAATGIVGAGLSGLGKTTGAAVGSYSDPAAMAADAAAKRVGVRLSLADLDPNSSIGKVETALPGRGATVQRQADDLAAALNTTKDVPAMVGTGTEPRVLPGENLRQGFNTANEKIYNAARDKFQAIDEYATANNLGRLKPIDTYSAIQDAAKLVDDNGKSLVFDLVKDYSPTEAGWMESIAKSPVAATQIGAPLTKMSDMRIAVNKALRKLEPAMARDPTQANIRFLRDKLIGIRNGLDSDIDNWGISNSDNAPAVGMLRDANQFYREVVVPDAINNKIIRKATKGPIGASPRGYQTANQFYTDVINNPELVGRVSGSMFPAQQDLLTTLQTAKDARKALMTGEVPKQDSASKVIGTVGTLLGHPVAAAQEAIMHLPGLGSIASTNLAKRMHFSNNVLRDTPLGRAAWAAGQYPREGIDQYGNKITGQ